MFSPPLPVVLMVGVPAFGSKVTAARVPFTARIFVGLVVPMPELLAIVISHPAALILGFFSEPKMKGSGS